MSTQKTTKQSFLAVAYQTAKEELPEYDPLHTVGAIVDYMKKFGKEPEYICIGNTFIKYAGTKVEKPEITIVKNPCVGSEKSRDSQDVPDGHQDYDSCDDSEGSEHDFFKDNNIEPYDWNGEWKNESDE